MTQGKTQSPWSPLRNTLFRNLWIASIVSNLGTWMHDVGAGWLMTSLSSSPSMVALVEAADSLPVMLHGWRHERRKSSLPAERFVSAIRVGMRFITHTRALQGVLIRGIGFFLFASATWSLFPLIVRKELGRGPEVYGVLLACIGVGAVAGAMVLPRVRGRVSRDALVAGASVLYALAALALAHVQNLALLMLAMLATGVAWISIRSALQVSAQLTLSEWVRDRGR